MKGGSSGIVGPPGLQSKTLMPAGVNKTGSGFYSRFDKAAEETADSMMRQSLYQTASIEAQ